MGTETCLVVKPAGRVEVLEELGVRLSAPEVHARDLEVAPEVAEVVRVAGGVGHVAHRVVRRDVLRVFFDEVCAFPEVSEWYRDKDS